MGFAGHNGRRFRALNSSKGKQRSGVGKGPRLAHGRAYLFGRLINARVLRWDGPVELHRRMVSTRPNGFPCTQSKEREEKGKEGDSP